MYAQLCKRLSKEAPNFDPPGSSVCTFLRLLLHVCRDKFENRSTHCDIGQYDLCGQVTSLLSSTSSSSNTTAAASEDDEKKHVAKQKMLGNVKFIGELCKLDMLFDQTLHQIIQTLLDFCSTKRHNASIPDKCEDMECLCQLFKTCGKNMDTEKGKKLMDQYFLKMSGRANNPKYPPRIRFMLRDVIELRKNNWIPRKVNTTEGPVPMHQLKNDEEIMRPGYINRNRELRNNDRDNDNWMNKLPLNLQPGLNDMFSSLNVSSPTPIISPYNNSSNNYNNRDHRGGDGGGGGGYRHNNQRNQNHNNYNNRFNNKHNNNQNNFNNSHNNSSYTNNMLNNKDLAPRFQRTLIAAKQEPVENLQMRPGANSLLFKANMNIKTTLPLSQPKINNQQQQQMQLLQQQQQPSSISDSNMIQQQQTQNHNNQHHHQNHNQHHHNQQQQLQQNNIKITSLQQHNLQQQQSSPSIVNNILNKEQIIIKQVSLDKPNKQNKKLKGPNKEEILKKVTTFINDNLLTLSVNNENDENEINLENLVSLYLDIKVPDKFMKDCIVLILFEILDKNDVIYDRIIEFLILLKKDNKLNNNTMLESFKTIINSMIEREATIPRITTLIASLLSRAVSAKLCNLSDISTYTENGQHYPLFLLILQQLHKNLGKPLLLEIFNESKVNLMLSLPEIDRNKDRMAEILEDRNLSFLYPLLKVQAELWKQIQIDSNPQQFYKWIKENVDANCFTDTSFITAMMTVLLKYITQETTLAGDNNDPTKNPEKNVIENEKKLLEKYCPVLNAFIHGNSDLQLVAIYALQTYCYSVDYPKGMLLRWFTALYEMNVIEEESFLRWKEDISDVYPGKGKALFQVNTWLLWLKEAEDEEDDE